MAANTGKNVNWISMSNLIFSIRFRMKIKGNYVIDYCRRANSKRYGKMFAAENACVGFLLFALFNRITSDWISHIFYL